MHGATGVRARPTSTLRIGAAALAVCALACGCSVFDESLLKTSGAGSKLPRDAGSKGETPVGGDARVPSGTGGGGVSGSTDAMIAAMPDANHADEDAGREPMQPVDAGRDAGHDDGGECAAPVIDSYCDHIPALPAEPVIDGELDCGALLLPLQPVAWNGTAAMPGDHSTRIAAGWRSNGLYLYVEVKDPTVAPHPSGAIYCGDAVELYVDADGMVDGGNYSDPGTMQFIVAAPSASPATAIEAQRFVNGSQREWPTTMLKTAVRADGYAIEVFLNDADLDLPGWTPMTRIGLDVALDVSGTSGADCGNKVGQYFMKVDTSAGVPRDGEPWANTKAFCAPALDAAP